MIPGNNQITIENDAILPQQFFDRTAACRKNGIMRLMLAILEDATKTLQDYHGNPHTRARRIYQETWDWCMADEHSWLFSFVNICLCIGIDADWLRQGIRRWEARCVQGTKTKDETQGKSLKWRSNVRRSIMISPPGMT